MMEQKTVTGMVTFKTKVEKSGMLSLRMMFRFPNRKPRTIRANNKNTLVATTEMWCSSFLSLNIYSVFHFLKNSKLAKRLFNESRGIRKEYRALRRTLVLVSDSPAYLRCEIFQNLHCRKIMISKKQMHDFL